MGVKVQTLCETPISFKKHSWLLVALSLLCAGWLLGYGVTAWNTPLMKFEKANVPFGAFSQIDPAFPVEPLSWRNAPTTRNHDSEP